MQVGEKFDFKKLPLREVEANYILQILKSNMNIFWSWGAQKFVDLNGKGLRFKVSGHHHKGLVYIVLNGADMFDVYYTDKHGVITGINFDIFFDQLVEVMDNKIERIAAYTL